jgi:hypothetical protein
LDAYKKNSINPEEQQELRQAIADPSNAEVLKNWIADRWEKEVLPEQLSPVQSKQLYEAIREGISPKKKTVYWSLASRIAVAASIVVAISATAYFWFANQPEHLQNQVSSAVEQIRDVKAPESTLATITLSNGQVIYIDSLSKGQLARYGGVEIVKQDDGQVRYKKISEEVSNNILTNPKGSEVITITLADGTRIWLNAASCITYPTSFTKGERKVELSGEAYFEVAKNEKMPFIVNINNKAEVKVLGTEFNIKSYDDEPVIKTTLVEGSVQVARKARNSNPEYFKLKPGEQASMNENGVFSISNVDIKESISWKEGIFYFNDTDLESIMKSLARWYDVEVNYRSKDLKELTFGAVISRRSNISNILNLMKMTGTVDFEISGKKIIVKNNPAN